MVISWYQDAAISQDFKMVILGYRNILIAALIAAVIAALLPAVIAATRAALLSALLSPLIAAITAALIADLLNNGHFPLVWPVCRGIFSMCSKHIGLRERAIFPFMDIPVA